MDALQKSIDLGSDLPQNWLFIAMTHWQLNDKEQARTWYDKSLAWRQTNEANKELAGFYDEAAKLLATESDGKKTPVDATISSAEDTPPVPTKLKN